MISPFKLNATLGRDYNADLDDTLRTKKALQKIGLFETPSYGMTEFPDEPLFKGIEKFQARHGLKQDGIMKQDGETATKLGQVLARNANNEEKKRPEDQRCAALESQIENLSNSLREVTHLIREKENERAAVLEELRPAQTELEIAKLAAVPSVSQDIAALSSGGPVGAIVGGASSGLTLIQLQKLQTQVNLLRQKAEALAFIISSESKRRTEMDAQMQSLEAQLSRCRAAQG
ncbi:MAG: hypothetical protein CMM61_15925 [Rhodospirillaceae bacterium]|nr:hypothetical protein [Rhodospirillaceae bacterium]